MHPHAPGPGGAPRHRVTATLVFAAALVLPGLAAAQADAPRDPAADFAHADTSADGRVDFDEFRNLGVEVFHLLDVDGDGRIAGREHPPAVAADGTPAAPGVVTSEGFQNALRAQFDAADANHDGHLDLSEWTGGAGE